MAIPPDLGAPSTSTTTSHPLRPLAGAAEAILGFSGALFVAAYIAGRFYFRSYASGFGLELSDFRLSIQDNAFGALEFLLLPLLPSMFLVALGASIGTTSTANRIKLTAYERIWATVRKPIWICTVAVLVLAYFPVTMLVQYNWHFTTYNVASALRQSSMYFACFATAVLVMWVSGSKVIMDKLTGWTLAFLIMFVFLPSGVALMDGIMFRDGPAWKHNTVHILTKDPISANYEAVETFYLSRDMSVITTNDQFVIFWHWGTQETIRVPIGEIVVITDARGPAN